jgi:hypothetical protein
MTCRCCSCAALCPHVLRLDSYLSWAEAAGYEAVVQDGKGGKAVLLVTLYRSGRAQLWWRDSRSRALLTAFLFTDTTGKGLAEQQSSSCSWTTDIQTQEGGQQQRWKNLKLPAELQLF